MFNQTWKWAGKSEAELLQRDRMDFDDGVILEMVIWRVPTPVKGSTHHYKYRLFYGHPQDPYVFKDVETLVRDFLADVSRQRSTDEKGNDPNPP
jgi:hypothetical protein